jgi:hypothetical protein
LWYVCLNNVLMAFSIALSRSVELCNKNQSAIVHYRHQFIVAVSHFVYQ